MSSKLYFKSPIFRDELERRRPLVGRAGEGRAVLLILVLYLGLAVAYSLVVPIGRGADEWAHYRYAQFIARQGRLPANPAEREAAGYKADWPPLYHLLAAGLTGWIETDGPPTFKYRQDNIRYQLVPAQGPEAILHTEDERFPWRQEILAWHLGRFLSIAFGVGTLVVTYGIGREVFADSPPRLPPGFLAMVAAGTLAFIPRFLFTGMLFSYDSLTLLWASLFLWLAIRVVKGYHSRWGFWGLGLLAGLALATKYLALLLPLEVVLVAWLRERRLPEPVAPGAVARRVGQAALPLLFIGALWFGYLVVNFNEVDTYGPVLGTLAPLIRGDGSDRTVEQLFAYLSGGQAPAPAYIEKESYTAWQLISRFFSTFWGNPVTQPYPLDWFVLLATGLAGLAAGGVGLLWRADPTRRPWLGLLLFHCALALPLMAVRLPGARDALEAVQGRHVLFLSGPAVAVLLAWGLSRVILALSARPVRWLGYGWLGLLLVGAIGQLSFMAGAYPPLLPVWTGAYPLEQVEPPVEGPVTLPGGAALIGYSLDEVTGGALPVAFTWQGGAEPPPEDYRLELALLDEQGQERAGWLAYQAQARYPTRAWQAGDVIRDEALLPLAGLPPGQYRLRWRLLGQAGEVIPWQPMGDYTLATGPEPGPERWHLWGRATTFRERETVLFTRAGAETGVAPPRLVGPEGLAYAPDRAGATWAAFIIRPDWLPGPYRLEAGGGPVLTVQPNGRSFQVPAEMSHPLEANFEQRVKLLGYRLPARRVEPGEGLPVTLYWQGLQWMGQEFVIFNRLLDNQGVAWGGYDRLPQENYSTLLWAPGEVVTDGFAVPVEPDAPPGVYWLSLGLYRMVAGQAQSLPIMDPESGQPTGATAVTIGPIKVGGPPPGVTVAEARPDHRVGVSLGQQIKLLGYDIAPPLRLTFYWQALAAPPADYTVFVHLRNEAGEVVAQQDGPPAGGAYPTGLWAAGEIIRDEVSLSLAGVEPGRYELVVGMYDFSTGVRLPVAGAPDDAIGLQGVEVKE